MVRFGREKVVLAPPFLIHRGLLLHYLFASNKAVALDQLITLKNALT